VRHRYAGALDGAPGGAGTTIAGTDIRAEVALRIVLVFTLKDVSHEYLRGRKGGTT
jgi:hypothetical protein